MNVEAATMKVDYFEATKAYAAYRQSIKENRATKDDVVLARAYHAMLRGKKVVDVGAAIVGAGLDLNAMPKLAIARADWPFVRCMYGRFGDQRYIFTSRTDSSTGGRRPKGEVRVRFTNHTVSGAPEGRAQVPTIPPQFRPKGPLSEYHLLFEAVWERRPTHDPMLLKRIGDNESPLFVVLAVWDLTPLEQAVLRAKL